MRRAFGLLLVLSWITLSGVDALKGLDFDSHTTRDAGAASGWPNASKSVELADDIVELANSNFLPLRKLVKYLDSQNPAYQTFVDVYSAAKALRSQKDHCCVLLI